MAVFHAVLSSLHAPARPPERRYRPALRQNPGAPAPPTASCPRFRAGTPAATIFARSNIPGAVKSPPNFAPHAAPVPHSLDNHASAVRPADSAARGPATGEYLFVFFLRLHS